ncbi:UDP-glucose dehydrogenase family protein [Legionella jordanis]|uniref:UDP-glucose 6-dehydrogenase n=1 Tax=Legionella jordanis TaxID=456 RepID=A0A0W0VFZ6_9GAMM|nr:UDP-glucose/GDP-mannose dehydrogenase family protein [Legionella jordanis]KTD19048.1 UDP-glucose 6-dehydrogenase [Legionella jordanis]RMX05397.1 UDP-glucose/GDP-mannose dehydrogenase family protein [Legionella jordanis]RMX19079.1 UDP-glucose/GDP-mannose dehydrogenase family protein [Legionella jordanis]VEH13151.1 UDP-glucose 6-dehydrogenase [Legionella jordanis]
MNISVYGAGYVGLVSAACLASLGHEVVCADIDAEKIALLQQGGCPLHEKDLKELLDEGREKKNLQFTKDLSFAIANSDLHFIATGTPSSPDGSADLSQVFSVCEKIAREINRDAVLLIKSTVPVGTGDEVFSFTKEILLRENKSCTIDVVSNPEFLREGNAVSDFLNAERIVAGGSEAALRAVQRLYQPLLDKGIPFLRMNRRSSELTKYAANTMLACKISFMNQLSRIAEAAGANIDDIRLGMGYDKRIGTEFLFPGVGYGGSCFPKDVRALCATAKTFHVNTNLIEAIEAVNIMQKNWVYETLETLFKGQFKGRTIGIWGLAFKPETDDLREASSLNLIQSLLKVNARMKLYDPAAMQNAQKVLSGEKLIQYCESASLAATDVDALVIMTEWSEFKQYSLQKLSLQLKNAPLVDGRNCYSLESIKHADIACYVSVGRPGVKNSVCSENKSYEKESA